MLKRFSAKRFRNVEAEGLEFRRVTVLVGPNNGGKSNLIDALRFYADVATHDGKGSGFHAAIERRGYGELLQRALKPPQTIELRWDLQVGDYRDVVLDIAFRVGPSDKFPAGFYITKDLASVTDPTTDRRLRWRIDEARPGRCFVERVRTASGAVEKEEVDVDNSDLVLDRGGSLANRDDSLAVDENYPILGDDLWWNRQIRGQRYFTGSRLAPRQIAASAKRNLSVLTLDESGSELVNVINNLERRHNDFLDPFAERLREMLSGLEKLRIDDISDQYKSLKLKIDGQWFRLDEISEGTLKVMALALLLFTPEKASMLSIDEPELNLHPAWLRVLGKWIMGAEGAEQVLISTHSSDLLDAFTDGFRDGEVALIVCDQKKGFRNVEPAALDSFFKDGWDLGDLYRVGEPQLGGWPW